MGNKNKVNILFLAAAAVLIISLPSHAASAKGYYRFPALFENTIVFSAEGDLWTVSADGGTARRLTTHPGEETYPALSPDGKTLAFSATYEGPTEVYTMPIDGGQPIRWTYEADTSRVVGFTPAGKLLYCTRALSTIPDPQLISLDLTTGEKIRLPLHQAGHGSFDASGKTLFFSRPGFHNNNTQRYQGGTARNIWKFMLDGPEAVNLTADFPGENFTPMWWNGRVYYGCDRSGFWNIWSMDENGQDLQQHTFHEGWDIRSPYMDKGRVIYQLGADLRVVEVADNKDRLLTISLASDFDQLREKWVNEPLNYLTSVHIHPRGESLVLTARGRVFVAPAGQGRLVQASYKEGVRYRDVTFMPDGKKLLGLSDESGELEFVLLPADGVGAEKTLTKNGKILRFTAYPSPDSKKIAFYDKNNDLWLLDPADGKTNKISMSQESIRDIAWSPDSRWLAYSQAAYNTFIQVHLYDTTTGNQVPITTDRVNSTSPAWSPDGKFIYFLSDRNLRSVVGSPWGTRQPEPFFDRPQKIYVLSLRKGLRSPFKPADELWEKAPAGNNSKNDNAETLKITIDLTGIQRRIREIPVSPGNYNNLKVNEKALFWIERGIGYGSRAKLQALNITNENIKTETIQDGINWFDLSADGKKLVLTKGNNFYIFDAAPRKKTDLSKDQVDLRGWNFSINIEEDFLQLFIDAWRLERDYFYDPGMHGLDWNGVRDKYLPLVKRVTTRQELNDLIGQVVGELSALHVSVRGGDQRRGPDQVRVATLGARLERDESGGGFRIDYIYRSDPDYPNELSPLDDPDLDIKEGDIILKINGRSTLSATHPNALLRNQAGRQVLLDLKSAATGKKRQVIVTPIGYESGLRYSDWEYSRRQQVEEAGAGEIGYVHLRAMGGGNITEWYRNFYPVFNRQGLIVDVRHNRGGNIDAFILEKLMRKAWFYWKGRVGIPTWNMHYAFRGHIVVLCDEYTASDGEAFAEGFRRLGLGKVIGTRTWGGEIWLSSNNRLTDRGLARAPQTGVYGPEREWLIEGHGVDPDIIVDNLPHATFKGKDAQLEAAIAFLKEQISQHPVDVPKPPPYPDKTFKKKK